MIIHELDVDMVPGGHRQTLNLNQGDSDFGILIHLYNSGGAFTIEGGTTARLCGKRPDGGRIEKVATLTGKDVVAAGGTDITSVCGKGVLEVRLTHGGKDLYSQNIPMLIEKTAGGTST